MINSSDLKVTIENNAVTLVHKPTGAIGRGSSSEIYWKNQAEAMRELIANLKKARGLDA